MASILANQILTIRFDQNSKQALTGDDVSDLAVIKICRLWAHVLMSTNLMQVGSFFLFF